MAIDGAGLYIHIPFCKAKCHYCSFNSQPLGERNPHAYQAALTSHLAMMANDQWCRNRDFASLFIGGGTPTVCLTEDLCRLLDICFDHFSFSRDAEITIEANPDTLSLSMLRQLRQAGVNRLSIGVQSFNDAILNSIGRIHSAKQGAIAVKDAHMAGFANINIDLMLGLPGQTLAEHQRSIETALSLEVSHLSVYELMLEEGAALPALIGKKCLSLPDEETTVAMLEWTAKRLAAAGFQHYEISNYCRPGQGCLHNINYWQNGSYVGVGAGAVSNFEGLRLVNIADPDAYCNAIQNGNLPFSEGEAMSNDAAFRETIVMGLRMLDGIDLHMIASRFPGALTPAYEEQIGKLCRQNLLCRDKNKLRLSRHGLLLANQALSELV